MALCSPAADLDPQPLQRIVTSTTRTWTDSNKDYVPNCDLQNPAKNAECGAMEPGEHLSVEVMGWPRSGTVDDPANAAFAPIRCTGL